MVTGVGGSPGGGWQVARWGGRGPGSEPWAQWCGFAPPAQRGADNSCHKSARARGATLAVFPKQTTGGCLSAAAEARGALRVCPCLWTRRGPPLFPLVFFSTSTSCSPSLFLYISLSFSLPPPVIFPHAFALCSLSLFFPGCKAQLQGSPPR